MGIVETNLTEISGGFVLEFLHQFANVGTKIAAVCIQAKLLAYVTANVIMTLKFSVISNFFTAQSNGIKTGIIDFIVGEFMLLKILDKFRVTGLKSFSCGDKKFFLVFLKNFHIISELLVITVN